MWLDDDLRTEAVRLSELSKAGLRIEAIGLALRIGRDSDAAAEELADIDQGALDEWSGQWEGLASTELFGEV